MGRLASWGSVSIRRRFSLRFPPSRSKRRLLCSKFAMRAIRKAWPLLVLLAEVLAFFRHILFYGHYAIPWDFRTYHLSQAWFIARSFARGELPLWDPYTYCGMPFYANLTAQLF